jgi:hypothetical protein
MIEYVVVFLKGAVAGLAIVGALTIAQGRAVVPTLAPSIGHSVPNQSAYQFNPQPTLRPIEGVTR